MLGTKTCKVKSTSNILKPQATVVGNKERYGLCFHFNEVKNGKKKDFFLFLGIVN